jgi:hypothetical protein
MAVVHRGVNNSYHYRRHVPARQPQNTGGSRQSRSPFPSGGINALLLFKKFSKRLGHLKKMADFFKFESWWASTLTQPSPASRVRGNPT